MFVRVGATVVPLWRVQYIDAARLESDLIITLHVDYGPALELRDAEAIDMIMRVCPAWFEGRRFRWLRWSWALHNFVGHPVLQFLAWIGLTRLGMWIHDVTIPRPLGKRVKPEVPASAPESRAVAGKPPPAS